MLNIIICDVRQDRSLRYRRAGGLGTGVIGTMWWRRTDALARESGSMLPPPRAPTPSRHLANHQCQAPNLPREPPHPIRRASHVWRFIRFRSEQSSASWRKRTSLPSCTVALGSAASTTCHLRHHLPPSRRHPPARGRVAQRHPQGQQSTHARAHHSRGPTAVCSTIASTSCGQTLVANQKVWQVAQHEAKHIPATPETRNKHGRHTH